MSFEVFTELWAMSLVRRANLQGCYAVVARKGDEKRGDALVQVQTGEGKAQIYGRVFQIEGPSVFARLPEGAPVETEGDARLYIDKRVESDPDLWVIDIEDSQGRHFLTERVLPMNDPFK